MKYSFGMRPSSFLCCSLGILGLGLLSCQKEMRIEPFPVAVPGSDASALVGESFLLDGNQSYVVGAPSGTKPDSANWTIVVAPKGRDGEPSATIGTPGNLEAGLDIRAPGLFVVRLEVSHQGRSGSPAYLNIHAREVFTPPIAVPGDTQAVDPDEIVTLDGSASQAFDGASITGYSWRQISGAEVTLGSPRSSATSFTAPRPAGALTFGLVVTDDRGMESEESEVVVTVRQLPPVAVIDRMERVDEGERVEISGLDSYDPNHPMHQVASWEWEAFWPEGEIALQDANTHTVRFRAPSIAGTQPPIQLTLTVTDYTGLTGTTTADIRINDIYNNAPVADAGLDETAGELEDVGLDGTGSYDPNGDEITYLWYQESGPEAIIIGDDTATPTVVAPRVPANEQSIDISLILRVDDGRGGADDDEVIITVERRLVALGIYAAPPGRITAGEPFSIEVHVLDSGGAREPRAEDEITISLDAGPEGSELFGGLTRVAQGGGAIFDGLSIRKAGSGYRIRAQSPLLSDATTSSFIVDPAAPHTIVFLGQPSRVVAGEPILPAVQVALLDAFENRVTSATDQVTLTLEGGDPNAELRGDTGVSAVNGLATFTNINVDKASSDYYLEAASGGLTASSASFEVTFAAPEQLRFLEHPNAVPAGAVFTPPVQVEILDAFENRVANATDTISLVLQGGDPEATLHGNPSVPSVDGVATFDDLYVDRPGEQYSLAANSGALQGDSSDTFDVSPAAPQRVAFLTHPQDVEAGTPIPTVQVEILDFLGNRVTTATNSISLALIRGETAMSLEGSTELSAEDGVAIFPDLMVTTAGSGYILRATSDSLEMDESDAFDVFHGPASPNETTIEAAPSQIIADGSSTSTISVQVRDAYGNELDSGGDRVCLTSTSGNLSGLQGPCNGDEIEATDLGNGTYSATITASTTPETARVTGSLNGDPITDEATVDFTPPASPLTTIITAYPTSIVADGDSTSTITVQAFDENGNELGRGGDLVCLHASTGVLSGERGSCDSEDQVMAEDNEDGTYTALLFATEPGVAVISGTLNGSAIQTEEPEVTLRAPLAVLDTDPENGQLEQLYSHSFEAEGGEGPYTYAVIGSLPAGLGIDGSSGEVSGTPSSLGVYSFSIEVADVHGFTSERAFSIEIFPALAIVSLLPPNGQVGLEYNHLFEADGGEPPRVFSVSSGGLPNGLMLDAETGALSGIPSVADTFDFTVAVEDEQGVIVEQEVTIQIFAGLAITSTNAPDGQLEAEYNFEFEASGGDGSYVFSLSGGSLPNGLDLSENGALRGMATETGSFTFDVEVEDGQGATYSTEFGIEIFDALSLVDLDAPDGQLEASYSHQFGAEGGEESYEFSLVDGNPPEGLALTSAGLLAGTPEETGSFTFTIQVVDAQNVTRSEEISIEIFHALALVSLDAPNGQVDELYSHQFGAEGGEGAYEFSLVDGNPPEGLALSSAGLLAGTPEETGSFTFTIQVADAQNVTRTEEIGIEIFYALALTNLGAPDGLLNEEYSHQFGADGGEPQYAFEVASGDLPLGLTLNADGLLQGTPEETGEFTFIVRVEDFQGATDSESVTISIIEELTLYADAGENQEGLFPWDTVYLSGSVSGTATTYELTWTITDSPPDANPALAAALTAWPGDEQATVESPVFWADRAGVYELTLTATSLQDETLTGSDSVLIEILGFQELPEPDLSGLIVGHRAQARNIRRMAVDESTGNLGAVSARRGMVWDTSAELVENYAANYIGCAAGVEGSDIAVIWDETDAHAFVMAFQNHFEVSRIDDPFTGDGVCVDISVDPPGDNDGPNVYGLGVRENGDLWIATSYDISVLLHDESVVTERHAFDLHGPGMLYNAIAFGHTDDPQVESLIVADNDKGAFNSPMPFESNVQRFFEAEQNITYISRGHLDLGASINEIWMASLDAGVYRVEDVLNENSDVSHFKVEYGDLPSNTVGQIAWEAYSEDVWIATNEGLSRYKRDVGEIVSIPRNQSGLCNAAVQAVAIDPLPLSRGRRVYVGCDGSAHALVGAN